MEIYKIDRIGRWWWIVLGILFVMYYPDFG